MQLAPLLVHTLDDHKAEDVISIDLARKADFADCMIIATGTSVRHVAALADHVVKELKALGFDSVPVEGLEASDWVLVDAGNVIVHIFRPEARQHYNLEKMWSVTLPEPRRAPPLPARQPEPVV